MCVCVSSNYVRYACCCCCWKLHWESPPTAAAAANFFFCDDRSRERVKEKEEEEAKKITCFRLSPILSTYVTFYNKVGSSERGREGECACTQLFYQDINVILSLSFTVKYSKERERECALPPSLFYGWMDGWMEGGFALSPFNLVTRA